MRSLSDGFAPLSHQRREAECRGTSSVLRFAQSTFPIGEGCYVVPLCQEEQAIFYTNLTLDDDQKEHQAKQTPALATLLYVDWDNQMKSDTNRSMVRRER